MNATGKGRVLITGGSGFTGHHMVMEAARSGFEVRATDISSRYYGAMFEALGVEFVRCDLTRQEGLARLVEGVDAVFHIAGIHDYSTPDAIMFAINVRAVENLCAACTAAGVERFIHVSSAGVYGFGWRSGKPVREEDEKLTPPLNNYNASKWEGEKVVQRYQREGKLKTTILRPAAIYGPRAEYGLYNVFKWIHGDRRRKRMLMVGRGERLEGFIHIKDVCRAVIFACGNEATIGEIYNVSDDSRVTTIELFRYVCRELLGVEKEFIHVPLRLLLPVATLAQLAARITGSKPLLERPTLHYLCCDRVWDNSKLKADGFTLEYPTIEKGLGETLRWYKQNGWLPA